MIQIRSLSKKYPPTLVLDALDFQLDAGKIACIEGASGCGKTTLLRLIAGLELPDQGEISLDGKTVSSPILLVPPYQRKIGFLFQTNALWPHLTVGQNVAFGLRGRRKQEIDQLVENILRQMELTSLQDRYPSQLSGGQLRRTALARTLVSQPEYLLLDEPLTNLDQDLQNNLVDYLTRVIKETGTTTLVVTHNRALINQLAGTRYILKEGKLNAV